MLHDPKKSGKVLQVVDSANRVSPSRKAADWLLEKVQIGKKGPFTEIITLTPDIAEALLANNTGNRPIRMAHVDTLVSDITENRWDLNGETIIVAVDGSLNDGQNRCLAVVQAQKSIRTAIMFGVNRDSRYTVDMGVSRAVSDFLAMEGAKNTGVAAAIARGLKCIDRNVNWSSATLITKAMIRQKYWEQEKQIQVAVAATTHKVFQTFGRAPCGVAHVLIHKKNSAECAVFFARLEDGAGLKRGNAILGLRNRMMTYDSRVKRVIASEKCGLIIRYWNAWRQGQDVLGGLQIPTKIPKVDG